jgi:hypothetical protein
MYYKRDDKQTRRSNIVMRSRHCELSDMIRPHGVVMLPAPPLGNPCPQRGVIFGAVCANGESFQVSFRRWRETAWPMS